MTTGAISAHYGTNAAGGLAGLGSISGSASGLSGLRSKLQSLGGDATTLSKGASMMQKLKGLQGSDPAKFKEVSQSVADKLSDAAGKASNSNMADKLGKLSDTFAQAAKTGELPSVSSLGGAGSGSGNLAQAIRQYASGGRGSSGSALLSQLSDTLSEALSGTDAAAA